MRRSRSLDSTPPEEKTLRSTSSSPLNNVTFAHRCILFGSTSVSAPIHFSHVSTVWREAAVIYRAAEISWKSMIDFIRVTNNNRKNSVADNDADVPPAAPAEEDPVIQFWSNQAAMMTIFARELGAKSEFHRLLVPFISLLHRACRLANDGGYWMVRALRQIGSVPFHRVDGDKINKSSALTELAQSEASSFTLAYVLREGGKDEDEYPVLMNLIDMNGNGEDGTSTISPKSGRCNDDRNGRQKQENPLVLKIPSSWALRGWVQPYHVTMFPETVPSIDGDPLFLAIRNGNVPVLRVLLHFGVLSDLGFSSSGGSNNNNLFSNNTVNNNNLQAKFSADVKNLTMYAAEFEVKKYLKSSQTDLSLLQNGNLDASSGFHLDLPGISYLLQSLLLVALELEKSMRENVLTLPPTSRAAMQQDIAAFRKVFEIGKSACLEGICASPYLHCFRRNIFDVLIVGNNNTVNGEANTNSFNSIMKREMKICSEPSMTWLEQLSETGEVEFMKPILDLLRLKTTPSRLLVQNNDRNHSSSPVTPATSNISSLCAIICKILAKKPSGFESRFSVFCRKSSSLLSNEQKLRMLSSEALARTNRNRWCESIDLLFRLVVDEANAAIQNDKDSPFHKTQNGIASIFGTAFLRHFLRKQSHLRFPETAGDRKNTKSSAEKDEDAIEAIECIQFLIGSCHADPSLRFRTREKFSDAAAATNNTNFMDPHHLQDGGNQNDAMEKKTIFVEDVNLILPSNLRLTTLDGWYRPTILFFAIANVRKISVITWLMEHGGADASVTNEEGNTVCDVLKSQIKNDSPSSGNGDNNNNRSPSPDPLREMVQVLEKQK